MPTSSWENGVNRRQGSKGWFTHAPHHTTSFDVTLNNDEQRVVVRANTGMNEGLKLAVDGRWQPFCQAAKFFWLRMWFHNFQWLFLIWSWPWLDPAHSNTPDPGHRQELQELPLPIFADPIAIKIHKMQCQNVPSHSSNSGLASGGSRGKSGRLDTDSCRHTSAGNALHPLRFLAPKNGAFLETPILVHNDFTMAAICRKKCLAPWKRIKSGQSNYVPPTPCFGLLELNGTRWWVLGLSDLEKPWETYTYN